MQSKRITFYNILQAVVIFFAVCSAASVGAQANSQTNFDFEQGTKGWQSAGACSIDKGIAHHGIYSIRIGNGYGKIEKTVYVDPLSIIQFNAYIKSSGRAVSGYSFINFYDSNHKLLLTYKSKPSDSTSWQQTGNYTETPANTRYAEIGVEKAPGHGYIWADDFTIKTNVGVPLKKHAPLCNLNEYMKPFWRSDTIFNETVMLYSVNGKAAEGKLLFIPSKILSVQKFDLSTRYQANTDYTLNGRVLTRTPNSRMPYRADTSFDRKKDLAWFSLKSQWVVVTYIHQDKWTGPIPSYKGDKMPALMAKLKAKRPVKIVAFGMSITRGMDVSSYDTVPPYMPTYVDLFARELRKKYRYNDIKLYNAGLPGAAVDWGAQYADKYINPLNPDLVIVDFGMNDFWRITPEQFKGYIQTIVDKAKAKNSTVEFVLLSNMKFDPDYILDSDKTKTWYQANMEGYSKVLKELEKTGMINLDMTALSDVIYHLKKAKDCIENPLHPNDYMARWYAQGLAQLLIK